MTTNGMLPAHRTGLPCAIDAMGGDYGFEVMVEGAVQAYREYGCTSVLVGPKEDLEAKLDSFGAKHFPITVENATEVIEMGDSPARAVRRKADSSLCVAYKLVQFGTASSIISAGNSGAMMAAGRLICGLLPGIERPAIAALIPQAGSSGANVVLDSGANVDCHAHNLVQFAIMGSIYYTSLFEKESPRVGILSNGTEASKGNDITRGASATLSSMDLNYIGYVEGRDVPTAKAEVIVCDGFVGNVLLKSMEGCVKLVLDQLVHEGKKGFLRKIGLGLSKGMYKEVFQERFDYSAYGGAPLLGLTKLALVLHGSSDVRAVKNAVRAADSFARNKMTEKIATALTHLDERTVDGLNGDILGGVFPKSASPSNVKEASKKQPETSKETPENLSKE